MVSTFYSDGHSGAVSPADSLENTACCLPPASPDGPGFLTANGSGDSHAVTLASGDRNYSPRAGQPYRRVSWAEIGRMVDAPFARPKQAAPFVILSTYAESDGRTHDVQRQHGAFGGLAVDIDKGNPSLEDVVQAVRAVIGSAGFEVYSSSSAAPDDRKWRVLIPLLEPVSGADYADTQSALFGLLAAHGLTCDEALARPAQPIYLPNVPPHRRGDDGQPVFYQSRHVPGDRLTLAGEHVIVEARAALRAQREKERVEAETRAAAYRERRAAYVQATGDDFDPIAHFNTTHTVAELLAEYGFERCEKPTKRQHYRSPLSTSGSFSTEDRGDHWITVSSWARQHGIGKVSRTGNGYGDAFDLFVGFKHGGDRRGAVRAYAAELGLEHDGLDPAVPVVVETLPDRGPARSLDEWRVEMSVERALALRVPGLHLDRSPTGSGKTTATIRAIRDAVTATAREAEHDDTVQPIVRSLIVLPDHANIREWLTVMQADGMQAAAYPARDETTCGNLEAVRRAESLGLTAGAAICWGCPLKDTCLYNQQMKQAEKADHVLGTHERLRLSPNAMTRDRDVIVIDETPETVLAPSVTVRVDDLSPAASLASTVRDELLFRRGRIMEPSSEERLFAAALVEAHSLIVEAARAATEPGVVEIPLPPRAEIPKQWQTTFLNWAVEVGVSPGRDRRQQERFRDSVRLLTMIVTGRLERLHLMVDQTSRHERQADGTVREWNPLHHFVVGSWKTALPDVPVICTDATADADGLRAATGREVYDCTPTGHLPTVAPVVQIPWDVTAGQSPKAAAGILAAILEANPQIVRLGLIGHQGHIRAIMTDDDVLPARLRARVAKACWHGAGPDRASNEWHSVCDAIVVVGTLRPGGGPVRERLIVRGKHEAARRDGNWGPRHWEAVTTDGRQIVVEGKGYRDPEWHGAHSSICRAQMQQCGGRGRGITDAGIPVWIISDEPMGCPVDDTLTPVSPVVREVVEAVRAIRDGEAGTLLFPIGDSYRKKSGSGVAVRVSAVADYLRATADKLGKRLGPAGVEKRLRLAVRHGCLERAGKGWLTVPDGLPVTCPAAQPAAPAPALVGRTEPAVVISATGPASSDRPLEVVADSPAETVTAVCTSTIPAADAVASGFADLLEHVDERAAILEHDGGLDRDTADLLAREIVMGRGVVSPVAPADPVGVDHLALAARMQPLVDAAVRRFGGTVRIISEEEDPFPRKRPARPPTACRKCGSSEVIDVPIHDGQSARRECAVCENFLTFSRWYGHDPQIPHRHCLPVRPPSTVPSQPDPPGRPVGARGEIDRVALSFLPAAASTTGPLTAA